VQGTLPSSPDETVKPAGRSGAEVPQTVGIASDAAILPAAVSSLQDMQTVAVASLELTRPRSAGVEQVCLWAMAQVGFVELLSELKLSGPIRSAIIGSIIARMAAPGSERAAWRYLTERSALGELLEVDFEGMRPEMLYRASDALFAKKDAIEQALAVRIRQLFALPRTITLYDLTNTYFEGQAAGVAKAKRGHSKENRTDCPLLTLALALDEHGFVERSEVFAGNAAEAPTLQTMLKKLAVGKTDMVVMDRGIATEENLAWLREQGYRYLVVSRERHRYFDANQAVSVETASGPSVSLQRVLSEDGEEVRLYCHSEAREGKERAIEDRFAKAFESGLQRLVEGLSNPRTGKRLGVIQERIGKLKARCKGAAQHYAVAVSADDAGHATAITWERTPVPGSRADLPGVYCLRSNRTDWDEATMWHTYTMLTDLEAVFRSLKSELGLRPIFHHKESRCDGHLFITVLAYQFVQIIRKRLGEADIHERWSILRERLAVQQRVTATFTRADGRTLHVRKATRPEPHQALIYRTLACNPAPGGVQKTVI
jgi:transposase